MTPYPGSRRIIETMPCAFRTLFVPPAFFGLFALSYPPEARSWRMLSPIEFERRYNAKAEGVWKLGATQRPERQSADSISDV